MKKYDLPINYEDLHWTERKKVREQYVEQQEWKCAYCGFSLKEPAPKHITSKKIIWSLFPPGFLNYPIHLQHNHKTKLTEGAVHNYCNAVMWQYESK